MRKKASLSSLAPDMMKFAVSTFYFASIFLTDHNSRLLYFYLLSCFFYFVQSLKIRKSDKTIDGYMVNIPTRHVTTNTLVSTKSCNLSEDPTNDHLVTESSPDVSASKRIVITNHFNGSICDALMDEDNGSDWEDVFETDSVSNGSQAKPMTKVKSSRRTASTPRISTTTTKSRRLSSSNMKSKLRKSSRHKKRSSSVCDTSYHVKNSPRYAPYLYGLLVYLLL